MSKKSKLLLGILRKNLNPSLLKAWNNIDSDLRCACSLNAHKRLEAVVEAEGGYIEKK